MAGTVCFHIDDRPWEDVSGLALRGAAFKPVLGADYTSRFSAELVRLEPGGHSPAHTEPYNHAFYILDGAGEVTIGEHTWAVRPGSVCLIGEGVPHSLRNQTAEPLVILVLYDPPRMREAQAQYG